MVAIIRVGAEVHSGDYLVGEGYPKGRNQLTPRAPAAGHLRREGKKGKSAIPL